VNNDTVENEYPNEFENITPTEPEYHTVPSFFIIIVQLCEHVNNRTLLAINVHVVKAVVEPVPNLPLVFVPNAYKSPLLYNISTPDPESADTANFLTFFVLGIIVFPYTNNG